MGKKHKQQPVRDSSSEIMLRPRLDALWKDEAFLQRELAASQNDLDVLTNGIRPEAVLQTMLRACLAATPQARSHLDLILPDWLRDRGLLPPLEQMATRGSFEGQVRDQAMAWLAAGGVDTDAVVAAVTDLFFKAFDLDDESQGLVSVMWYNHARKKRVHGINFLIDHNPPWDGAVKDIMLYPALAPQEIIQRYVAGFTGMHGKKMTEVSASQAKTRILACLGCNRAHNVRLPQDLILNRAAFNRFVLALPDQADTPRFTDEDWDFLSKNGETPESIMYTEETVGRRVRTEDGKEVWILGASDLDEF